jgi:prepilin-type N-terminal cleavage/methylation domain-containing protein
VSTRTVRSERGFTLIELMIAALITTVIMGVAFSTFDNALALNDSVLSMADSSQNLRAGTNLLVRDLMQAGRNLEIGGIPIPSGTGSAAIHRPSPPGKTYFFNNTTATSISPIVTGAGLGPTVDGRTTDIVTILMSDPFLADLTVNPFGTAGTGAKWASDGVSFNVGSVASNLLWLQGDATNEIPAVKVGDLMYFLGSKSTLMTVTKVDSSNVYFEPNDPFNFNQPGAAAGNIAHALGSPMTVRRVYMYSYWVADEDGVPRLMRALNMYPAVALAGIVEDLDLTYDLVDGVTNPVNIGELPYTAANGDVFTASQIRKVNVHVGVRSETKSKKSNDYLRNHVSTVVSLRNFAYVDKYK